MRAGAVLAILVLAGCGTGGRVSEEASGDGRPLFQQKCGGCHQLADAGTNGNLGPSLDDAFAAARKEGFHESTIREVVLGQMRFPSPPMPKPTDPQMFPPGEYTEEEREAAMEVIAGYVASVAASAPSGGAQAAADPKSLFNANCSSCHTLADAGSTATIGPNLDRSTLDVGAIEQQIRRGGGGMPPFEGRLTDAQIEALAKYVAERRRR